MRRLEIRDVEITRLAVQQEIQRSEESRYDHRLHGLLLCCLGLGCYRVADMLGQSPRTVEHWVQRFERSGFAGLQEQPRPGRPTVLDATVREQLGQDLRRSPRSLGYEQNLWDGRLLSHHIRKTWGLRLGVRQCQRLFRKFGFRRRKPRPVIAQADPEAQKAYKKTRRVGASRRPRPLV
jgi:transposase